MIYTNYPQINVEIFESQPQTRTGFSNMTVDNIDFVSMAVFTLGRVEYSVRLLLI